MIRDPRMDHDFDVFLRNQYDYQILPDADKDWRTKINKETCMKKKTELKKIESVVESLNAEITRIENEINDLETKLVVFEMSVDLLEHSHNVMSCD